MTNYALDPTGISPNNKIVDETKVVTPPALITDANFVVPNITPFFKEGFIIRLGTRTLVEGVDYQFVFRHIAASTHFQREIFGGVMFINKQFSGTVKLTYQVLGGEFSNPDPTAITGFTRAIGIVRWLTFDQILGVPSNFPPAYHEHDLERDLIDMGDVVDSVENLAKAVRDKDDHPISEALSRHIRSPQAHSKSAVGLGNVANFSTASYEEARNGSPSRYITADILKMWWERFASRGVSTDMSGYYSIAQVNALLKPINDKLSGMLNSAAVEAAITKALQPVNTRINAIRFDPTAQETRVAIESIIGEYINSLKGQVNGLVTKTNQLEESVSAMRTTLSDAISGFNRSYVTTSNYNIGMRSVEDKIQALTNLIDAASRSGSGNTSTLSSIMSAMEALSNRVTRLQVEIGDVSNTVGVYKVVSFSPTNEANFFQGVDLTHLEEGNLYIRATTSTTKAFNVMIDFLAAAGSDDTVTGRSITIFNANASTGATIKLKRGATVSTTTDLAPGMAATVLVTNNRECDIIGGLVEL